MIPLHHSALLQLEQVLNALDLLSCNMLKTLCAALALDTMGTLEPAVISNPPSQFAGLDLEPLCQALRAWGYYLDLYWLVAFCAMDWRINGCIDGGLFLEVQSYQCHFAM